MKQITIPELVKICAENKNPVTRQAVHKAIKSGLFPFGDRGGKKYLDLDNPAVQEYIHGTNRQREAVKKPVKPVAKKKKPAKKRTGKPAKKKPAAKKPAKKPVKKVKVADVENLEPYEMNRRAKFADMRKRELQVLVMEKKYLPIDFIDAVYIKHLENFHAIMERTAATYIQDIGKKILEAGEVMPDHIEKFTAYVLEAIFNNKRDVKKWVSTYEPHL